MTRRGNIVVYRLALRLERFFKRIGDRALPCFCRRCGSRIGLPDDEHPGYCCDCYDVLIKEGKRHLAR